MTSRRPFCALVALALLSTIAVTATWAATGKRHHHPIGLILRDGVILRSAPSNDAHAVSTLYEQSQVVELARRSTWMKVRIWASLDGWVPAADVTFRKAWTTVSTYHAPSSANHPVHAYPAQPIQVNGRVMLGTALHAAPGGAVTGWLPAGRLARISSWKQDAAGAIWYRTTSGWAAGSAIRLLSGFSAEPSQNERRWKAVSGKGMWLTLGTIAGSDPEAIVEAARHDGITHLYLESAISPLGFHGRESVGPLIDAAHRAGITVIAWVYPYLYDLAGDVALTRQVAAFRTAQGHGFDGIAVDLENNITTTTVREYSGLIRAYLGPHYLLIGVTYPPQSFPTYPFVEVAQQYDVIAPMDYWRQTRTAFGLNYGHMRYGFDYSYRYAADSIGEIRAAAGAVPIAPIGQTFDDFARLELGPLAPSGIEETGFLQGSKSSGAIGASFFQWMTASVDEWRAIRAFRY